MKDLVIICSAILLLISCIIFFLFTKSILPLFVAMVMAYLFYKRIDAADNI